MTAAIAPPRILAPVHRFLMLDLLRGIAALAVLVYHLKMYLGVQLLPSAYFAVDLFFLVSGFVITHNYDPKIAGGMSFKDFIAQRLIRLYPCFILCFVLGFVLAAGRMSRDYGYVDGWGLALGGVLNGTFLPAFNYPFGVHDIYPFNGSSWTLTFELFANIVYWLTFRFFTLRRLVILLALVAIFEIASVLHSGTIDVGMRASDFYLGFPRVILPYFTGVLLRRHLFDKIHIKLGDTGIVVVIVFLLTAFSLPLFLPEGFMPAAELIMAIVVLPLLLLLVSRTEPGPRLARLCQFTGDVSYPVYLLQNPFIQFYAAVPQLLLHMKAKDLIPWIGILHLTTTIACAYWVDKYYELPIRNKLKGYWSSHKRRRVRALPA